MRGFISRIFVWRDIIWQGRWRKAVLIGYGIVAAYDIIQSQFLPLIKLPTVSNFLPDWQWWIWLIIGWGVLWLITLEGAYRIIRNKSSKNWIDDYKVKTGKLPPLPDYLAPLFGNYSSEPVSKAMIPITPSGQCWHGLLPSQQKQWRQVVEWLGRDPEDYLAHMRMMAPKNPPGIEKSRWPPFKQH